MLDHNRLNLLGNGKKMFHEYKSKRLKKKKKKQKQQQKNVWASINRETNALGHMGQRTNTYTQQQQETNETKEIYVCELQLKWH